MSTAKKKPVKASAKTSAKTSSSKAVAKPPLKVSAKPAAKKPAPTALKVTKATVKPAIKPAPSTKKAAVIAPPAKAAGGVKGKGGTSLDFLAGLKPNSPGIRPINLDLIDFDEFQPRDTFFPMDGEVDPDELREIAELAENIHEEGLHQAVVLVPNPASPGRYKVGMGERRVRAFLLNREKGKGPGGSKEIPASVRDDLTGSRLSLAQLSENLQRKNLTDLQVARFLRRTLEKYPDLQKQELGKVIGKGSQYVSRVLALLNPQWADVVDSGYITYASLLEQYRALPAESQAKLKEVAKNEKRPLTSGDIRDEAVAAKTGGAKPTTEAGTVLSQSDMATLSQTFANLQVPGESYSYAGQKPEPVGQRKPAQQQSFDNVSDLTLPNGPQAVDSDAFSKHPVKLSIGQLSVIANSVSLPDDIMLDTHFDTKVIKSILAALGVPEPDNSNLLVTELLKAVNKANQ